MCEIAPDQKLVNNTALFTQRLYNDLTQSDDLPEEDAEAPAVGLLTEGVVVERLWRHPPDRQSTLADRTGNTVSTGD